MKKLHNKNNGITLVALVVTIIILLILAGVSISALTCSGLFGRVKESKQKSENAQEQEEATLGDYENSINEYVDGSNRNIASGYRIYETKLPTTSSQWIKILDGEFDEDNDYIIGYKIYTDGLWQQCSSIGAYVVTFMIKDDGIYSFCNYSGSLGQNVKIIISNFQ